MKVKIPVESMAKEVMIWERWRYTFANGMFSFPMLYPTYTETPWRSPLIDWCRKESRLNSKTWTLCSTGPIYPAIIMAISKVHHSKQRVKQLGIPSAKYWITPSIFIILESLQSAKADFISSNLLEYPNISVYVIILDIEQAYPIPLISHSLIKTK